MTTTSQFLLRSAIASLALAASSHAATVFVTNDNGNAADLDGAVATTVTPLTLSAGDGGGTLNVTTLSVLQDAKENSLGMDGNSLGVAGDRFGINNGNFQTWIFSFDQTLSFDGVQFIDEVTNTNRDSMSISSSAWEGLTGVTDGSNWTFDSVTGTITTGDVPYSSTVYDFTGAGLANITSGTSITIAFAGGNGGTGLESFTVSVIPEPGSLALISLAGLSLLARRRR
ncbi:PEP-CTERM sorting domain-containing protein [Haloferula sp. A504]|uniref:PEP-CTERM sorting domain-containing protein n=1 Tax=Haloferula sp. A504 TaxID=3373601 RepID=UPI0031C3961F|nr:PEP-CTERM sorting domain-containing protein [Verrucomicrobiaceae bacterium E54]